MTGYRFTSSALVEVSKATLQYEKQEKGLGVVFLGSAPLMCWWFL